MHKRTNDNGKHSITDTENSTSEEEGEPENLTPGEEGEPEPQQNCSFQAFCALLLIFFLILLTLLMIAAIIHGFRRWY